MTQRTPESALQQYKQIVERLDALQAEHKAKVVQLETTKTKIENWLTENVTDFETPEWLFEVNPSLNWQIGVKSDGLAVKTHMHIDDGVLVSMKQAYDQSKKPLDECVDSIEKWGLEQLLARGSKGFKSTEGSAQLRTDTKYQIVDKKLFVDWAVENQAEAELTITLRPNSKFMSKVVEDSGELPQGVSSFREQKCVFVKG